jgi:hypothetical protein
MTIPLDVLTERRCPCDRLDGAGRPGPGGCFGRTGPGSDESTPPVV